MAREPSPRLPPAAGGRVQARDFRGMPFDEADMYAKNEAERRPRGTFKTPSMKTCPAMRTTRRSERVELGSDGQDGQRPLGALAARSRSEKARPRPCRRVSDRESPRGHQQGRFVGGKMALEDDFSQRTIVEWAARQVRPESAAGGSQKTGRRRPQEVCQASKCGRPTTRKKPNIR